MLDAQPFAEKKMNRKTALTLSTLMALSATLPSSPSMAANRLDSRLPRYAPAYVPDQNAGRSIEPKNLPDFATGGAGGASGTSGAQVDLGSNSDGTALKAGAASTTLPVTTRLTLVLESPVDAKVSQPGDLFEAHVRDDLFLGSSLLLPKGSLVRGRVYEVTKPKWISRAAKIGLKLEQIDTPAGEVIPLDAALEFHKGQTNAKGQLDPGTNFGTRVGGNVKAVTGGTSKGATKGALIAANVATLGAPAVATVIGGSAVALFKTGDNVQLAPGQEIEVLLTNDLGVQLD
jgi:hypothetical protein